MELIEKKVKRRTPVKIKTVNYKDFEINYVEMKGFFRLFFGKLFDKFEKPYYTYVDDYVVFSNKAASLLSFVVPVFPAAANEEEEDHFILAAVPDLITPFMISIISAAASLL